MNRTFKSNLQKNSNRHNFKTTHRICIKFDRLMWPNEKTSSMVPYDDTTIPRWLMAAIFDFDLDHNFGVDQHFCTKFGTEMENRQPKGTRCS